MTNEERSIEAAIAAAFSLKDFCGLRDCGDCPFYGGTRGCKIAFPFYAWELEEFEEAE